MDSSSLVHRHTIAQRRASDVVVSEGIRRHAKAKVICARRGNAIRAQPALRGECGTLGVNSGASEKEEKSSKADSNLHEFPFGREALAPGDIFD
jgi:hypothetical protein